MKSNGKKNQAMKRQLAQFLLFLSGFVALAHAAERPNVLLIRDLGADPAQSARVAALRRRMEDRLQAQDDPRMSGRGHLFDDHKPTNGDGFQEKFRRGEKANAGGGSPTDFEKAPLVPEAR